MADARWTVYWNEYASDTYLYGSEISWHGRDDVEFFNEGMPPGTVIKQWYSRTDYQAQRIEPALPLIDGESAYRLIVNIDCPKGEQWLVRLLFFDRYGTEAGSLAVRERKVDFRCPLKTYSYRMQLINGGMTGFRFHSIVIQEVTDEESQGTEKNKTAAGKGPGL